MRMFVEFFICNFFGQNDKMWKVAFFTFLAIGEKRKLRHQIPPRYILGHHRQWKFLKKKKKLDRYFQGSLGPQECLWSRTIIFFFHGESLFRTTQKYHLEGPESRRWASLVFRFACDSQKCEKCEKSGNFKISHFSRPDWPFTMSDHLILMY